jgi:hypothetical protein
VGLSQVSGRAKEFDIGGRILLGYRGSIWLNNVAGGGLRLRSERSMDLSFICVFQVLVVRIVSGRVFHPRRRRLDIGGLGCGRKLSVVNYR